MDERRGHRAVTDTEVECHFGGLSHRLSLHDLSAEGCMVEAPRHPPKRGGRVLVKLLGPKAVAAHVAWFRGGFVGLRFLAPLPADVVQLYASSIREHAAERFEPRDRFGRRIAALPTFANVVAFFRPSPASDGATVHHLGNGAHA